MSKSRDSIHAFADSEPRLRQVSGSRTGRLRLRTLAALLILSFVSGCTGLGSWRDHVGSCRDYVRNGFKVGPEYCKPAAPVGENWIDEYDNRVRTELPNYADWWTVFNDPVLDALMEQTYRQNLDLRAAGLRVLQARYIRGIAVGGFFPQQQQAFGSYTRTQNSQNVSGGALPLNTNTWATGAGLFWEIDFWGKFRRNIESADASLDASVEDYDAILISLLAETASTYVDLRTAQQRLEYAKSNVEIQEGGLKLADIRLKARSVSKLDVTQAENIVANTEQLIPLYENQIRVANNALCVLLGIPPRDLTAELGVGPIPVPPADVVVGIPANLLRRRPDVRAAERQVAAQSAAIGVATADLLPHFSITGSISLQADSFEKLFESASLAGLISPGFSWDILNYGRLLNNVRLQDAAFQENATMTSTGVPSRVAGSRRRRSRERNDAGARCPAVGGRLRRDHDRRSDARICVSAHRAGVDRRLPDRRGDRGTRRARADQGSRVGRGDGRDRCDPADVRDRSRTQRRAAAQDGRVDGRWRRDPGLRPAHLHTPLMLHLATMALATLRMGEAGAQEAIVRVASTETGALIGSWAEPWRSSI